MSVVAQSAPQTATPEAKQSHTIEGAQAPKDEGSKDQPKLDVDSLVKKEVARHRRAIDRKMRELEERERLLTEKESSLTATQTDWKEKLKQDPLEFLEENGFSWNELTERQLNRPQDAEIRRLEAEIRKLKSAHEEASQNQQAQKNEQYEQAKKQIKLEIKSLVDSDESFEAIRANGEIAQNAVVQLIEDTFHDDGYLMSVEDAVKEVEDYLLEQAVSLAQLKKVQSKLNPTPAPIPPVKKEEPTTSTTLSNRTASSSPKDLTDEERRQRAILAFQGRLNT